jgi:ABC-2 type transport system ATP-binding protein
MEGIPSIEIQKLHKNFGKVRALKNVNLKVDSGQIYGLLGPNGAGKTTLIRLLIGSTQPTSGKSTVLGLDPTKQKHRLRRSIGYMPQSPALYDDLSVRDNISFFARAHHLNQLSDRVSEVIDFVRLSERADDPIFTLSGGMKQRASLACALVHDPKILFLDEPTSGIDPKLRMAFWEHFRDLAKRDVTLLISTHQMDEAMYCDRLAILHEGTLLADDTPNQLLWNSQAKVDIQIGNEVDSQQVTDYPQQLPEILRKYGLDPTISRIEIEEETLESIVLRMIQAHEDKLPLEAKDDLNV